MTGTIFVGAAEYSVGESDPFVAVTIKRTGDLSGSATVNYGTNAGTASEGLDYVDADGTVTMAPGVDSVTVNIPILNDGLFETTERFNFSIINVDPTSTILFPRTANIAILDDENPVTDPAQPPLTSPFTVTTTTAASGFNYALSMEWMPGAGNKALVVEKAGIVKYVDMNTGVTQSILLDIRAQVNNNADRGLLDIALHPDLANNPYLYAFYVVDPAGAATASGGARADAEGNRYAYVSRFTLDLSGTNPTIVPGSETVLLGGAGQSFADISGNGLLNYTDPAYANRLASNIDPATGEYKQDYIKVDSQSHAGGALVFGPDGYLYVATGDGSSFDYADPRTATVQDIDSLNGKILRVDPITGDGVADNPYATGDLTENASKVWQSGLRNPYTMTFSDDGRLFISETGWYTWEEINSGAAGANFGWPFYEGGDAGTLLRTVSYQNHADAQAFYAKVDSGEIVITPAFRGFSHVDSDPGYQFSAIVGSSTIYTGDKYPAIFANDYFFTDIVDGEIFSVDINDRTKTQYLTDIGAYGPANFVQGPDGYMYMLDLVNGRILRLNISDPNAGENHAPTITVPLQDVTSVAGSAFSLAVPSATFSDIDNDPLTLSAKLASGDPLPAWLAFNPATGAFTGTSPAGQATSLTIAVTATDPFGETVTDQFVLTTQLPGTETVVNDIATQIQDVTGATANDVFVYAGPSTAYGWGPTDDRQGLVVWTLSAADTTYDVLRGFEKLRFSDKTISISSILQTGPDYLDDPQVIQHLTGTSPADRFIVNAPSADYSWGPTADGGGTVIWTNSTTDNSYDILKGFETLVFTDRQVSLVGPQPNRAPTLVNAIADQTATADAAFSFTLPGNIFADADGDALARTAVLADGNPLPAWLSFNPTTGAFSGTPTSAQVGTLSVRVIATDPGGLAASDVFDIRIDPVSIPETLYNNVAGTQTLTGTSANDVFVLGASSVGYQWGETQDGSGVVVWNASGYDILYGFEQLRFTNKSVALAPAQPGTYQDDPDLVQHLTGKTSNDTFVIAGQAADYDWGPTSDNAGVVIWTVSTTDDTYDILRGFETLQFDDQSVDLA